MNHWSNEETDDPIYADTRNFYKVEKWTRDGLRVERMLYAGNSLDKARALFSAIIKHRPRIRLMIRQRGRVLEKWPATPRLTYYVKYVVCKTCTQSSKPPPSPKPPPTPA
jgi:hypothetical protein